MQCRGGGERDYADDGARDRSNPGPDPESIGLDGFGFEVARSDQSKRNCENAEHDGDREQNAHAATGA
jgi:hypothetical protein